MDDARTEAEQPAAAAAPSFRRLLTPQWIAFTIVVVLAVAAFLFLAWWQLNRFESSSGSWQNFGYTLQWPFFAAFAVYLWWKLLREPAPPPGPESRRPPDTSAPAGLGRVDPAAVPPRVSAVPLASGDVSAGDEAALPPLPSKRPQGSPSSDPMAQPADDPELEAYNDYLKALHRRSLAASSGRGRSTSGAPRMAGVSGPAASETAASETAASGGAASGAAASVGATTGAGAPGGEG